MLSATGAQVVLASIARPRPEENAALVRLRRAGITTQQVAPNDPSFDDFVRKLAPDLVIFDRFVLEEQFGWRVRAQCPHALRVIDTQDLHFLRKGRERALSDGASAGAIARAEIELHTTDAAREIAAIYRSDLSLVLSDFEHRLLEERFGVPKALLFWLPFAYPAPPPDRDPAPFAAREHFVTIGNFRHAPNADGVRWLQAEIWPRIRPPLPRAELHVYGAYPPRELMRLDDSATGFRVRGSASGEAADRLSQYRVNLAALRFGAGLKGKIAEGWRAGTPTVATAIGWEGMRGEEPEAGREPADDSVAFAQAAVRLYGDSNAWAAEQARGWHWLTARFDAETHRARFAAALARAAAERETRRHANFVGQMLWHHTLRSTEYFSKWIELKNLRADSVGGS